MSKLVRGLPEWANYLLKVLFVMIFPLFIYASDISQILFLPSSGFIFTSIQNFPAYLVDFFVIQVLNTILRNFIIGIIIAFPGIYFNYKLTRTPLHKSSWKRGIGLSTAIYFITLTMVMFLSQFMFSPILGWNDSYWELYNKIIYYPSLVLGVFIILPLVLRQAIIISVPSALHHYSMREIESSPKFNLSREKMLSAIFWLFICFAPYTFQYDRYSWYGGYMYTSFLMDYRLYQNWYEFTNTISVTLLGQMAMFPNIPFVALLFALNFMFVRDVYRYLRRTISKQRLIGMAILSCLFPLILTMGPGGFYIYGYMPFLPIPIPIIQFVGLLIVRYHRPEIDQSERVWKADRDTMWWETERVRREVQIQTQSTPEKPIRHREETITIPVGYLFLSRVRSLRSRIPSIKGN